MSRCRAIAFQAACPYNVRMPSRAEERVELRASASQKRKWLQAAERTGTSLSGWARRHLDEIADQELGSDDEPPAPSPEAIHDALQVAGSLQESGLRARIHAARETPWTTR